MSNRVMLNEDGGDVDTALTATVGTAVLITHYPREQSDKLRLLRAQVEMAYSRRWWPVGACEVAFELLDLLDRREWGKG